MPTTEETRPRPADAYATGTGDDIATIESHKWLHGLNVTKGQSGKGTKRIQKWKRYIWQG